MTRARVEEAISEVKRFLKRADALLKDKGFQKSGLWSGTAATAAVRRSSLDLTKALAALRKPNEWGQS